MILFIVFILLMGIGYAYFATDLFKSKKELFLNYIAQIEDETLKGYWEKQKNTSYESEGEIVANNNISLNFSGPIDNANRQIQQAISLNYSKDVKFPFHYKEIDNIIGIQTDYIGGKYVATKEEENLILGQTNVFQKSKDILKVELSENLLQRMKETYFNVLKQELQENDFSLIEETNSKGYQLTLKGERLKNIIVKLLETLKNDQITLDKINEYLKIYQNSSKITTSHIDNKIKDIHNSEQLNEETLEIAVYQTKGKTNRIMVKTKETEFKMEKQIQENEWQYNIEWQTNQRNHIQKIQLIAKFQGLETKQEITENHQLTLETEDKTYHYNYQNKIRFVDNVNIEPFTEENSMILNQYPEEQVTNFMRSSSAKTKRSKQKTNGGIRSSRK